MAKEKIIFDIFPLLPATSTELGELLNKDKCTLNKILKRAKKQNRVHVGRWHRPSNGLICPVWYAGPGLDAECLLKKYGRKEIGKRYRLRQKAKTKAKPHPFQQLFNI